MKALNISDAGYMGIRATISSLAPLLQPRRVNPHATLITLFLNAVMQLVKMGGEKRWLELQTWQITWHPLHSFHSPQQMTQECCVFGTLVPWHSMQRNFSISMSCKIAERPALNAARYENQRSE